MILCSSACLISSLFYTGGGSSGGVVELRAMERRRHLEGRWSPRGLKRAPPVEEEMDRICDIATKRFRMMDIEGQAAASSQGEVEGGAGTPEPDYEDHNRALKRAHLEYIQERQRRGLPSLHLPHIESDEEEDEDDSDDEGPTDSPLAPVPSPRRVAPSIAAAAPPLDRDG